MKNPAPAPVACPCCGYLTLSARAAYELCPVCRWEDDGQGDADAHEVRGGANGLLSLAEARANFEEFGACSAEYLLKVRPPKRDEIPEP